MGKFSDNVYTLALMRAEHVLRKSEQIRVEEVCGRHERRAERQSPQGFEYEAAHITVFQKVE